MSVQRRSYDVKVPNKTIYVSEGDLPIYQRAQELAGDNLSAAIAAALRRYVDVEEGHREGFDEFIVRVGPGKGRKVRFTGVLLGEWVNTSFSRVETFRVYAAGRANSSSTSSAAPTNRCSTPRESLPAGAAISGSETSAMGPRPPKSTLEVVETLDDLPSRSRTSSTTCVAGFAKQPAMEDLDI